MIQKHNKNINFKLFKKNLKYKNKYLKKNKQKLGFLTLPPKHNSEIRH